MKILYNQNPLKTVIELDETDKKLVKLSIRYANLEDLTYDIIDGILETIKNNIMVDYKTLEKSSDRIELYDRINAATNNDYDFIIEELSGTHIGDCTCMPASCTKCRGEEYLGINTISGLTKHQACIISNIFNKENITIIQVLNLLLTKTWEKPDNWSSQKQWEEYLPGFKQTYLETYNWLYEYYNIHKENW